MTQSVLMQAGCLASQHIGDIVEIADAQMETGWFDTMRLVQSRHSGGLTELVIEDPSGIEWVRTLDPGHTVRVSPPREWRSDETV